MRELKYSETRQRSGWCFSYGGRSVGRESRSLLGGVSSEARRLRLANDSQAASPTFLSPSMKIDASRDSGGKPPAAGVLMSAGGCSRCCLGGSAEGVGAWPLSGAAATD